MSELLHRSWDATEHLGEEFNAIDNTLRQIHRRARSQMEGNHYE